MNRKMERKKGLMLFVDVFYREKDSGIINKGIERNVCIYIYIIDTSRNRSSIDEPSPVKVRRLCNEGGLRGWWWWKFGLFPSMAHYATFTSYPHLVASVD